MTKAYLSSQPDFRPNAVVYANHYIGYDPKNPRFQEAASFLEDAASQLLSDLSIGETGAPP